jgi:hypothetical protein
MKYWDGKINEFTNIKNIWYDMNVDLYNSNFIIEKELLDIWLTKIEEGQDTRSYTKWNFGKLVK